MRLYLCDILSIESPEQIAERVLRIRGRNRKANAGRCHQYNSQFHRLILQSLPDAIMR